MKLPFQAVIFDFDGVVVNSAPLHEAAWVQVARARELFINNQLFRDGFGVKNERFIAEILQWTQDPLQIQEIIREKEAAVQQYLDREYLDQQDSLIQLPPVSLPPVSLLVAGIQAFLKELQTAKIPFAVGSSAIRKNIDMMLKQSSLLGVFDHIVSGDEVKEGKPDPEVFLKAAQCLNIPPSCCLVIEDAPLGALAAKNANMPYLLMTTTFSKEELQQWPLTPLCYWESFQGRHLSELETL